MNGRNKEEVKEYQKQYRIKNREHLLTEKRKCYQKKKAKDPIAMKKIAVVGT